MSAQRGHPSGGLARGLFIVAKLVGEVQNWAKAMSKPDLVPTAAPPPAQRWTHIDQYLRGLARRRTARRSRQPGARTEPEAPQLLLSTLPFAVLIAVLGLLIVAFAIAAWPASQPNAKPRAAAPEQGTAAPGWLDEAKKEMR